MKTKQLLLSMLAIFASFTANAYDAKIDGIYYVFDESYLGNEAWVTYRSKNTDNNFDAYWGDVNIPNSVTYGGKKYKVTAIGDHAFNGCSLLDNVTIPNSVTSIGDYAFRYCDLDTITIPNSLKYFGEEAFIRCIYEA